MWFVVKLLGDAIFTKKILLLILFLIIINIVFDLAYSRNAYLFGGDYAFAEPYTGILKYFFIYNYLTYSGLISNTASLPGSLYGILFLPIYYLFGIKYAILFKTILVPAIIGSSGMFLLVYTLIGKDNKTAYFSACVGSLLFTLQFVAFQIPTTSVIAFPFMFLSLYLFIKHFYNRGLSLLFFSITTLLTAFEITFLGYNYIIWGAILVLSIIIVLLLFNRKDFNKLWVYLLLILLLSILINFSYLFTTYLDTVVLKSQFQGLISTSAGTVLSFYYPIVEGITEMQIPYNTITSKLPLNPFLLIIFIMALIPVLYYFKNLGSKKVERSFIFGFLIALLVFLSLATEAHKPFGIVFLWLYKKIDFLVALRYPSNFQPAFGFVIPVLFGLGSFAVLDSPLKKNRACYILLVIAILSVTSYFIYLFAFVPITLNYAPTITNPLPFIRNIPEYTTSIANYVNKNINYSRFSVATLPADQYWHLSSWYYADNIYGSLINAPVYTGGALSTSGFFFPQTQTMYLQAAERIDDSNKSMNISAILGIFGIRYIIIEGNSSHESFDEYHTVTPFNFNAIYYNLNRSKDISFVSRYANSSVYVNNAAVPLVYSSDIVCTNLTNTEQIIKFIGAHNSINIRNYSVYSSNVTGYVLDYGNVPLFKAQTDEVSICKTGHTVLPRVSFVEKTPTNIFVNILNATAPYYLVFRETYDPAWSAYYSNGTSVPSKYHIMVNGFANAWYINKTGNYTITLYYTLQTDAWIAWGVSFAALFVTLGIGAYGWREIRKGRRR